MIFSLCDRLFNNKDIRGINMEQWDLYTKDRIKTGKKINRGERVPKGHFRTVVHVAIFDTKGKMLIQQRQKDKKLWAGLWDVTAAGSVIAGESSLEAAEREVFEEIGHEINLNNERPAFTIDFDEGFDDCYLIIRDLDIDKLVLQEKEVQNVKWATEEEILQMIEDETFISYHKSKIELMFFLRNQRGTHTRNDKYK